MPDCWRAMAVYFFDFRAGGTFSFDDEGEELRDIVAAHDEALEAFAQAIREAVTEGRADQHFAVEVRDELGPVLAITGVIASTISRKQ
jgi:hypothetical protein